MGEVTEPITENLVRAALLENKGDLIASAEALGVRASRLVGWIRSVPDVRRDWEQMRKIRRSPEFEQMTAEQFAQEMEFKVASYRLDGLEVIHELATTDHGDSAGLAEVRLRAAIQLRGDAATTGRGSDGVLTELNKLYQENAPRIKSMRAVQIEFKE